MACASVSVGMPISQRDGSWEALRAHGSIRMQQGQPGRCCGTLNSMLVCAGLSAVRCALQVAEELAATARVQAEAAAAQLQGAEAEVRSSRRRTRDFETAAAAKIAALEHATLQNHQLQVSCRYFHTPFCMITAQRW